MLASQMLFWAKRKEKKEKKKKERDFQKSVGIIKLECQGWFISSGVGLLCVNHVSIVTTHPSWWIKGKESHGPLCTNKSLNVLFLDFEWIFLTPNVEFGSKQHQRPWQVISRGKQAWWSGRRCDFLSSEPQLMLTPWRSSKQVWWMRNSSTSCHQQVKPRHGAQESCDYQTFLKNKGCQYIMK